MVNLLQGSNYVTISLVYPMLGTLLEQLEDDQPVRLQDERADKELYVVEAELIDADVKTARRILRAEIVNRFYDDVQESDLEDVGLATILDPRYGTMTMLCNHD